MPDKILILHIPVIHKGYLDFLNKVKDKVSKVFIIDVDFQKELSEIKPDIASLDAKIVKDLLAKIGFENISILSQNNLNEVRGKEIILVQDEISRNLAGKYLKGEKIEWDSVFLRWDKNSIVAEIPLENIEISNDLFDVAMMKEADGEAQKSGDWWRQVGAVIVKDKQIVARACNQGVPNDYTPYQVGMVRDFFKAGEKQELSNTTHAEPRIIGEAAKKGIGLDGTSLYVTHFPCAVCAKFVAYSGIKKVYFREGASTLDGKTVLESADVKIYHVPHKNAR
ncbi:MAG: deaminase [bacterium]|nr:deaminase [bacterium]